jgi:O-methyltransferase
VAPALCHSRRIPVASFTCLCKMFRSPSRLGICSVIREIQSLLRKGSGDANLRKRMKIMEQIRALVLGGQSKAAVEFVTTSELSPNERTQVFRDLGGALFGSGRAPEAIICAEAAVELDPTNGAAFMELLHLLLRTNHLMRARKMLRNGALPESGKLNALRDLISQLSRSGQTEMADIVCEFAGQLGPAASILYADLIREEVTTGNLAAAVERLKQMETAPELRSGAFRDLGGELEAQKNNALSLSCRRVACQLNPLSVDAQRELIGGTLRLHGRKAALVEAEKADFGIEGVYRHDFTASEKLIYTRVCGVAIASPELVVGLVRAAEYVLRAKVPGAFVECGVFRGGSTMAVMLALLERGVIDRDLFLYDTFAGFPLPDEIDLYYDGRSAIEEWHEKKRSESQSGWLVSTLEETRTNVLSTGYPIERMTFVEGMVEDTIPKVAPEQIAFLRLDTDFYASTRHELIHFYDRIAPGGVLIIDDYGAFQGARKAVDEFFERFERPPLLHRIDSNVRIMIKDWIPARDPGAWH